MRNKKQLSTLIYIAGSIIITVAGVLLYRAMRKQQPEQPQTIEDIAFSQPDPQLKAQALTTAHTNSHAPAPPSPGTTLPATTPNSAPIAATPPVAAPTDWTTAPQYALSQQHNPYPSGPPPPTPRQQRAAAAQIAPVNVALAVSRLQQPPMTPASQTVETAKATDKWLNQTTLQKSRSPYTLYTGTIIPGTMISGVNSELPGSMLAMVSRNIYDTATGSQLLIPQGSRLFGVYSSKVQYGQSRVLVAWNRIIFPNASTLDLGTLGGGDTAGFSGFKDQVNNHYFRIFGSAILLSLISGGTAYGASALAGGNTGQFYGPMGLGPTLAQHFGLQIGGVASEMLRKNINISPTIIIRPGYAFSIIAVKDLVFPQPYQQQGYRQ